MTALITNLGATLSEDGDLDTEMVNHGDYPHDYSQCGNAGRLHRESCVTE